MRREAAFGVFCLTTVYPTDTTGLHGNSGGKSARKDVFPSGKGRKKLFLAEIALIGSFGSRMPGGSSPFTPTKILTESGK